jgi:Starch-binding associating with outer membrane
MKKISYILISLGLLLAGCTGEFEEMNTNPNFPTKASTSSLLTTAQKAIMDHTRDEWWGGRQTFVWSQYLSQNNYTNEDRYLIRQGSNNSNWGAFYMDIMDLVEIIHLNTDEETKAEMSVYGPNENQIAVARILKAYMMQIMTDSWGDIPYFEAFDNVNHPGPAYDSQESIYMDLIKELTEASAMINLSAPAFTVGDIFYGGDPIMWKRLANSLKLRVAIRMKNVPDSNWEGYFDEAVDSGVFESNGDNAIFTYPGSDPNNSPMYTAFRTASRNDFTFSKQFLDILKGVDDTVNNKVNPFHDMLDPRLAVFISDANVEYSGGGDPMAVVGMPIGVNNSYTYQFRRYCPHLYYYLTVFNLANAKLILMSYPEVCFLRSERNNWDQSLYEEGVSASLDLWGSLANELYGWSGSRFAQYQDDAATYLSSLPPANNDRVITQKYINGFLDGNEAWAELRRTGLPSMLVKPGEITYRGPRITDAEGKQIDVLFTPIINVDEILPRITYPYEEQTLNAANYEAAANAIGGDKHSTHLWWHQ